MQQYHDLLNHIVDHGDKKWDRTWIGTTSVFWYQMRFDLSQWFPLVTTKKVNIDAVIHELLWFIAWDTNISYLVRNGVNIRNERPFVHYLKQKWESDRFVRYSLERKQALKDFRDRVKEDDDFAAQWWELWPVYGKQRRDFSWVDQLARVCEEIATNPSSRRLIVSARNPVDIPAMMVSWLPPCHVLFQFYVQGDRLSCHLYQRSGDVFLWIPFNIASYALLTHMVAHVSGLQVGDFVHTIGDAHIYDNHIQQVQTQLEREMRPLPTLTLNPDVTDLFACTRDDIVVDGYDPHPWIKAQVAV